MRRRIAVAALIVVIVVGVVAVGLFVADYVADPPTASCAAPPTMFGAPVVVADHQEVAVRYLCEGAAQAGTLYLPRTAGPHPAVVWVHGAGADRRLGFGGIVMPLVNAGIAVFSYDKRGVGESQGSCCPGDNGHFNLLSSDVVAAVAALASRSDIRRDEIGLVGASQAGWVAPKAAVASSKVAFLAFASATPLTERQANLYERLARGDEGAISREEIARRLASAGPSGFDPVPYLRELTIPSLWMIGTADDRIPPDETVALLARLKSAGNDITVVTFEGAGHGLLDTPPSDPSAPTTLVDWIVKRVHPAR